MIDTKSECFTIRMNFTQQSTVMKSNFMDKLHIHFMIKYDKVLS